MSLAELSIIRSFSSAMGKGGGRDDDSCMFPSIPESMTDVLQIDKNRNSYPVYMYPKISINIITSQSSAQARAVVSTATRLRSRLHRPTEEFFIQDVWLLSVIVDMFR